LYYCSTFHSHMYILVSQSHVHTCLTVTCTYLSHSHMYILVSQSRVHTCLTVTCTYLSHSHVYIPVSQSHVHTCVTVTCTYLSDLMTSSWLLALCHHFMIQLLVYCNILFYSCNVIFRLLQIHQHCTIQLPVCLQHH
jgi:hypothetical protein